MSNVIPNLAGYRISLVDGFPECTENEQVWRYRVEFDNGPVSPDISSIAFQLCENHFVNNIESPSETFPEISDTPSSCLELLNAHKEIKWNIQNGNSTIGGEGVEFQFTLDACYKTTNINVALKQGDSQPDDVCNYGLITGPSCEEIISPPLPPGRGIAPDKIHTLADE